MSSRVLNSRFNRRTVRASSPSAEPLPQAPITPPEPRKAKKSAATTTPLTDSERAPELALGPVPAERVRFGFVRLFGKLTVIEVSEEVWGSRRYYKAVFSEDPSVCIKALHLEEAVSTLIRHLMRSPTIRRFHFGQTGELDA